MHNSELIGSRAAAELLGVSRATVNRAVRDGRLKPEGRIPGKTGAWLFDSVKVANLAESLNRRGELNTREGVS